MTAAPAEPNPALLLDNQLCFPLYAAARQVVSAYGPFLKPMGLTYTQYIVLLVLWERDGLTVGELCRRLLLDSGTLTPVLKRMETDGRLCRERSREDERVVVVRLTDNGRALRSEAVKIPAQMAACMPLTMEEALQLHSLLYKIIRRGGEPDDPEP